MVHFFVLTAIVLSNTVASSSPAQWHGDYGKALAATRGDDRPLLIVLDVPNDPKAAATDAQLDVDGEQAKLLSSYQLCRVDASTEYGQQIAKMFQAEKFPLTAIIDKTGSVVLLKKQGKLTNAEWNQTLSAYKSGERAPQHYTSAYRGPALKSSGKFGYSSANLSIVLPSRQRNAQQSFSF